MRTDLKPGGLKGCIFKKKILGVKEQLEGVYIEPASVVDLEENIKRQTPATKCNDPELASKLSTLLQQQQHEADCTYLKLIMALLDRPGFGVQYALDIETDRLQDAIPSVYPMTPSRPFYQRDMAGDFTSRLSLRYG